MIKKKKYFFLSIIVFIFILFLIDLTNIDTKYVNRSFIDIDVKNLNSKYSKKTSNYLRLFYLRSFKFLNEKEFNKRWGAETSEERNLLPEEILIPKKKKILLNLFILNLNMRLLIIGLEAMEIIFPQGFHHIK